MYEREFTQALQRAAEKSDSACFEVPGATSRWGMAKGLRQNALDMGGRLLVSPNPAGWWQTQWDIGTIDRDTQLSDEWFGRDQYEQEFTQALQRVADKSDLACFETPGAASRWGMVKGLRRQNAVDLANQVLALWEKVLVEWETRA